MLLAFCLQIGKCLDFQFLLNILAFSRSLQNRSPVEHLRSYLNFHSSPVKTMWFCSTAAFYGHTCHRLVGRNHHCQDMFISARFTSILIFFQKGLGGSVCHSASITDSCRYSGNTIPSILTCFNKQFQRFPLRMNQTLVKSVRHLLHHFLELKRSWTILYRKFQSFTD